MKSKFGIKTRVFLSFWFFIILFTNIFSLLMYIFVEKSFILNVQENISLEYNNIKKIIDETDTILINLNSSEVERIENAGLFFYIWYNDKSIIENYNLWTFVYWNNIIFRWDYDWYNILIWKNINDLNNFKKNLLETNVLLNIFGLFITFTISYFVTNRILRPLTSLSKYISSYNIEDNKTFIINKYWSSEIWLITDSLNKFIRKVKETFDSQKFFIQDASHELKTPLMQIESNIELLELDIKDKKSLERLENIRLSVENINQVISNLSFLVRWKEQEVQKQKINIGEYLNNFVSNFEVEAKKKNIKIELIEEEKIELENNVYYLDRLFWNLISNSISYNEWNNTIKITIKANQVIIEDEWIWIDETERLRIFNRFYRSKNSWLYNCSWSGLGLSIVKTITDSFSWGIEIESELWKFTRITLTF